MITQEELKELLHYDPLTGVFTWLVYRNQLATVGSMAGFKDKEGYRIIHVNGKSYKSHRLAFLYVIGKWPTIQVDHINHDVADNRWVNLREATNTENSYNVRVNKKNIAGLKWVSYRPNEGKYIARVTIGGIRRYVGYFKTAEDAHEACAVFAKKYHGEFYCAGA